MILDRSPVRVAFLFDFTTRCGCNNNNKKKPQKFYFVVPVNRKSGILLKSISQNDIFFFFC